MAELQKRLQSRRTGISSEKKRTDPESSSSLPPLPSQNKSIGAQAMDNVMAKIPEPTRMTLDSSDEDGGDEDDDWAD